jgi:hypothetical protein
MSWNYRIVHLDLASPDETWMEIREVYYDETGKITSWTAETAGVGGDDLTEIAGVLELMRGALEKPVLKESDLL